MKPTRMTFAEYQQLDGLHWSVLREARRSPLHYRHREQEPLEDTTRLAIGRAAHTAIFELDRFMLEYACFDGERRQGKKWKAFVEANPGRTILKVDEYKAAIAMRDAVRAHPVAGLLLARGEPERVITWTDSATGIACKARPDWWRADGGGFLLDLKTTGDIEARRFGAWAGRLGYHCQLAFYRLGLRANGLDCFAPRIVAVEAKAPHDVAVFVLAPEDLDRGEQDALELLRKVSAGRFSGQWPGRYPEELPLELPSWLYGADDLTGLDLVVDGQVVGQETEA